MRDGVLKRFWEDGKPNRKDVEIEGVKIPVCFCGKRAGEVLGVLRYDILTAMCAEMKRSFRIGLASARANLVPMLVLQLAAAGPVAAYLLMPGLFMLAFRTAVLGPGETLRSTAFCRFSDE